MVDQVSDFKMPEKIVSRLLKEALPEDVVLSKDAKNLACRSASIFILQLSIAAAERAQVNRRRLLDNQDIIKAASELGLAEYAPQLVRFGAQRKRNAKRKESSMHKGKVKRINSESEPPSETPDINGPEDSETTNRDDNLTIGAPAMSESESESQNMEISTFDNGDDDDDDDEESNHHHQSSIEND